MDNFKSMIRNELPHETYLEIATYYTNLRLDADALRVLEAAPDQAVVRYTYLSSEKDNGLRLALYENTVVPGRGDEYNEIYLGLNYYFYKHKLKVQTGVQYADMKDRADDGGEYSGWAWTTGLRISW